MSTERIKSVETINTDTLVAIENNQPTTTSLKIAEYFGKRHADVLKKIETLETSQEFRERNFSLSFIDQKIPNGASKQTPMYQITKDGFTFLTMGFTGARAAKFKENYILAFNKMEETLKAQTQTPPPISTAEGLLASIQLMVNIEKQQKEQEEILKKQGEKLMELETKATGVVVDIHSVAEFKTVKELEKDYLGREINYFINKKYVEARGLSFQEAHRTAWKDYRNETGFDYAGAKFATKESKQHFLDWLKAV